MLNENKQVIQKDIQVRLKLVGTRTDATEIVSGSLLFIYCYYS
jgi:hypothetical protein